MHRIFLFIAGLVCCLVSPAQPRTAQLEHILIETDKPVLNPVLHPQETARLSVRGIFSDGTTRLLPGREVVYSVKNKLASGREAVLELAGNRAIPREGGMATVTAIARVSGQTQVAALDILVRPYYRDYHQTLVLKLFLGMEGEPVERLAKDPLFQKKHDVLCTFEEALEVIRKTDNLTLGIPKIVYLVGWQKGGHDHQYPSWDTVNPKLKREQDSTALESLRWLIRAARVYHTTVSLHINMVDAYRSSPLWDEYVKKDVLAKDLNGQLLTRDIQIRDDSMYIVSYTREWMEGLAQQRIDRLIAMVPELKEGHTIHVDAFIDKSEKDQTLSPWHALPQNGGIDIYREAETQHKIFKYWRARGFDVTGEGLFWAHPPGEGFYGLQPMSWWYPSDIAYQMATPENLSARGGTDRHGDGDFRFGNSMHGEEIYNQDKINLPGFLGTFCRNTLPWYYLSRLSRLALVGDTLFYSGAVQAATEHGHRIIRKGNFILRDDDDLFVPALWKKKEIVAYSQQGYGSRYWLLPADWSGVHRVDISRITLNGTELITQGRQIRNGRLELSLQKQEAISIVPAELQFPYSLKGE
ncbi:MAG TPA: endo-alpha-N-acetylgalactosaminidase family protein [Puia sp.]|nr:endo-alpha-N-acetylgalactosaminidase family protein [Puia sp.]